MDNKEFLKIRRVFNKAQKQMAQILGVSLKTVNSYEQGWRNIPVHVERQLLFLLSQKPEISKNLKPCWKVKKCRKDVKIRCPAWEFKVGKICWFINGTICEGGAQKDWKKRWKYAEDVRCYSRFLLNYKHKA